MQLPEEWETWIRFDRQGATKSDKKLGSVTKD
jgi:hypothetical protein